MSWAKAKGEADRWLQSLQLGKLKGQSVDLREPAKTLAFEGKFRTMVLQAAARQLKASGATAILPDLD